MSDREALAAALKVYQNLPLTPEFATITKAAYKYLAQLPEKCGTCINKAVPGFVALGQTCPTCHGSGKVYPAELVEQISRIADCTRNQAVAVLDALNGETE